jgi:hypothetical protein
MSIDVKQPNVEIIFEAPKNSIAKLFGNVQVPYGKIFGRKNSVLEANGQCNCENGSCDCNCSCDCGCE